MRKQDKYEAIRLLHKHHEDFIKIALTYAGNHFRVRNYAEDFVQEAYLKLLRYDDLYEKVIVDGEATKGYMFFVIKSVIINDIKKKSNLDYTFYGDTAEMDAVLDHEEGERTATRIAKEEIEDKMHDLINEAADNPDKDINRFDALTFRKYLETRKSYAKMAAESGVGERTIYLAMQRCKELISTELEDDYREFMSTQKKIN